MIHGNTSAGRASLDALDQATAALGEARTDVEALELSENMAGDQRAIHLDVIPDARSLVPALERATAAAGFTGCSARGRLGPLVRVGNPAVGDPIAALTQNRVSSGQLRRQPTSFFQANRFLLPHLVVTVLDAVLPDDRVLDLYAGVGLVLRSARRSRSWRDHCRGGGSEQRRGSERERRVLCVRDSGDPGTGRRPCGDAGAGYGHDHR